MANRAKDAKIGGNGQKRKIESFEEFETDVLTCRSLRHAWDPQYMALGMLGRTPTYELRCKCLRCPTTRTDIIKRSNGDYLSRTYGYPPNYLIGNLKAWGGRAEFNGNVRLELYERLKLRKSKVS